MNRMRRYGLSFLYNGVCIGWVIKVDATRAWFEEMSVCSGPGVATNSGGGGRDTGDSACEVGSDKHIWTGPNYKLSRSVTVTAAATAAVRTARA